MQDMTHWDTTQARADLRDEETMSRVIETLSLIDPPPDEAFDKFTRLVEQALDVPVSLISILDDDRHLTKSEGGLLGFSGGAHLAPVPQSFCQHVTRQDRPLVLESAPRDALVSDNLTVRDLGARAYLGVPVHGTLGESLGALCAIDTEERLWTEEDIAMMNDLGECVSDQIKLREAVLRAHES